jgi:hypothetical protein
MAEATDAAAEVEGASDEIEEAAETAETLAPMAERVEETIPEGGMGEAEAGAVEVAVEHLCSRVGFSMKKRIFPAMEGFAKPASRVQATKIALESIKEKAAKIWEQIVAAIKRAIEYVKTFFAHLMNAAAKYAARAEAIAKKASSMKTHAVPADAKVKQAAELTEGGKHVEGAAFVDAVKKHCSQEVLNKDRVAMLAGVAAEISKLAETDAAGAAAAVKGFTGQFKAGEEMLVLGNASVKTEISEDGSAKVMVGASSVKAASEGAGEVSPATPEEVMAAATAIAEHLKGVAERAGKATKEAEAAANAVISKVKGAQTKENAEGAKAAVKMINGAIALTTTAQSAIAKYDVKVCAAALGYCASSLGKAKDAGAKNDKAVVTA